MKATITPPTFFLRRKNEQRSFRPGQGRRCHRPCDTSPGACRASRHRTGGIRGMLQPVGAQAGEQADYGLRRRSEQPAQRKRKGSVMIDYTDTPRDEIERTLDRLSPMAISALLAIIGRFCPTCGKSMIVRTSKRTPTGDRLAHLRCRACGTKKTKVVRLQP